MRRAIYEDDIIKLLDKGWKSGVYPVASNIHALPSAQSERDTPRKPTETTSKIWGIREKEPVCPKCGYYLGHWRFQGKYITYCESCGQAIDWEGWDFNG